MLQSRKVRSPPSRKNIPASDARRTIGDVIFAPARHTRLVDIHVHHFRRKRWAGIERNCVRRDEFTFRSGVLTVVDAGKFGLAAFGEISRYSDRWNTLETRVFAMLNIVSSEWAAVQTWNTRDNGSPAHG